MHQIVRSGNGPVGPARCAAIAAIGLALLGSSRAQFEVPLPQVLAEVEQAIAARRPGDAAPLLEHVLSRATRGEPMPAGLAVERLRLAAASAHFQVGAYPAAEAHARSLLTAGVTTGLGAEARMILGLSLALQERFAEAVPIFVSLEESASHRDRARPYLALAARQAGMTDRAIEAYERHLSLAPRDADWADAALSLISLYLEKSDVDGASRGISLLQGRRDLVDNLAGLNLLGLRLGDRLFEQEDPAGALRAYQMVLPRDELRRLQAERSRRIEAQIARLRSSNTGLPAELDSIRRLEARGEGARRALAEIETEKNYDAAVQVRLGNAFLAKGAPWEAALAFAEVLQSPPESAERPPALLGLVRARAESGRFAAATAALARFRGDHPGHALLPAALYQAVVAAQNLGNSPALLELLEQTDAIARGSEFQEPLIILQVQALLGGGRHETARECAARYLESFPRGRFSEEACYLHAMAGLLMGESRRGAGEIRDYLRRYPQGRFADDAGFRLASALYAMEENQEAIRVTETWLREHADDHPQRGEVYSLQGDAWAALARLDRAIPSYREALRLPLGDELLGYVLDELTGHYQSLRDPDGAVAMWEGFARERPDHPYVVNAAYWIGRIHLREGRREEALRGVAEIASRYLVDPAREGVERLLVELAGMLAAPGARGKAGDNPAGELADRIESLLLGEENRNSPTARARVLYTRAEVASVSNDQATFDLMMDRIAAEFEIEALPPGVLGRLGDYLVRRGRKTEAGACYSQILSRHRGSIFADFGYVGLGNLSLDDGRAEEALERFEAAIDVAGARFKLREATIGRARASLALGRLDAAEELFQQVAANRQWRGELTAESVWSLGEICMRRGGPDDLAHAQAHFQRVYLSYRKFVPWVARAYLRSAQTFHQLGRLPEAVSTLQEMLRDDRLAVRAEAVEARRKLAEWNAASTGEEA